MQKKKKKENTCTVIKRLTAAHMVITTNGYFACRRCAKRHSHDIFCNIRNYSYTLSYVGPVCS